MKKIIVFLCAVALVLGLGGVCGAAIIADYTVDVQSVVGLDPLGLSESTWNFMFDFSDTATYIDRFGFPAVDALSDSLTISGASVATSNGVYTEPVGIGFYPTFSSGQFHRGGPSNGNARYTIGSDTLTLIALVDPTIGANIGDTISVADFGTTLTSGIDYHATVRDSITFQDTDYLFSNLRSSITQTTVPVPAAIYLLGAGFVGIAGLRRKLKK
jgi:hypothetical protein